MSTTDMMTDRRDLALTNWDIRDIRNRTLAILEATDRAMARRRMSLLRDELQHLPRGFSVTPHTGPIRAPWYGDGWFRVKDSVEELSADAELSPPSAPHRPLHS